MAFSEGMSLDFSARNNFRTPLSSVGGFSQPACEQIHSVQDLLQTIQRLNLTRFEGPSLKHVQHVGEGTLYKVSRSVHRSTKQTYAVKHVKLPSATAEAKAFQEQVTHVLRDIEIMAHLFNNENILTMFGYGWNTLARGPIPFLVTEFAQAGTLRVFLNENQLSVHEKLILACDVAHGLHVLHECGIVHGDLKLDNVLVTPWRETGLSSYELGVRSFRMKACISGFGHSFCVLNGSQDMSGWKRYGGTAAYKAPEISSGGRVVGKALDFRKCDVWSLGLLSWETLRNGDPFYHNWKVQEAVSSHRGRTRSSTTASSHITSTQSSYSTTTILPSQYSATPLVERLGVTAPLLADIACEDAEEIVEEGLYFSTISRLCETFQMALSTQTQDRVADLSLLPAFSGSFQKSPTLETSALVLQPSEQNEWSFQIFLRAPKLSHVMKNQILIDCKRRALEPGDSISSAKAAFQCALACISGFGGPHDPSEAFYWTTFGATKGLELAQIFLPFFETAFGPNQMLIERQRSCTQYFKQALRRTLANNSGAPYIFDALRTSKSKGPSFYKVDDQEDENEPGPQLDIATGAKVRNNSTEERQQACHMGDADCLMELLSSADHTKPDGWGAFPIHWLFMFPDDSLDFTARLLSRVGHNTQYNLLNAVANGFVVIDPQLPVRLSGTPLAFATASGSIAAVRTLLSLGADPLIGKGSGKFEFSAWMIACMYHLTDIMEHFLPRIGLLASDTEAARHSISEKERHHELELFHSSCKAYSAATRTERILFHGKYTIEAAKLAAQMLVDRFLPYIEAEASIELDIDMASLEVVGLAVELCAADSMEVSLGCNYVQEIPGRIKDYIRATVREMMLESLCLTSVGSGDDEVIRAALETVHQYEQYPHFKKFAMNRIFLECTSAACSGTISSEVSRNILQTCLDAGGDINCEDKCFQGARPISIAIQSRNLDIIEWFIQNGADLTAHDDKGNTSLHHAIISGLSSLMDLTRLTSLGASTEAVNNEGISPIEKAIILKRTQDVQALLEQQAREINPNYSALLQKTSTASEAELVSIILEHIRDSARPVDLDLTPALAEATINGNAHVIRTLIDHGARASEVYQSSWPCLHLAALYGIPESVEALLQAGDLKINQRCHGATALELSLKHRSSYACANILIDAGADVNLYSMDGRSYFDLVVEKPRCADWQQLAGKILYRSTHPHFQHFETSIRDGDLDLAFIIVDSGVLQDASKEEVYLPLHFMAGIPLTHENPPTHSIDTVTDLTTRAIAAGGDPYRADQSSQTPLEIAALSNNRPVCLALLRYMAPVVAKGDLSSQAKAIFRRAWKKAVRSKSWGCMCAFHQIGFTGDTEMVDFKSGCKLLLYALKHKVSETLVLFMGSPDNPQGGWDPYLHRIWKVILDGSAHHGRLRRAVNLTPKNAVEEIPDDLRAQETLLKSFTKGYTLKLHQEFVFKMNFCEAQSEPDLKEVWKIGVGPDPDPELSHAECSWELSLNNISELPDPEVTEQQSNTSIQNSRRAAHRVPEN